MHYYRTTIYHDNIDNVSRILANFFNLYIMRIIMGLHGIVINNDMTNFFLIPNDCNFQRFVDTVTTRDINPMEPTLTHNIQTYQRIFSNNFTSLEKFMKFVLGTTYLLKNSYVEYLEDVYPFIGITYFVYNKIYNSSLLNSNPDDKSLILRDIRNLWSIFLFRKTKSHSNL
jgi:hypothetical protein